MKPKCYLARIVMAGMCAGDAAPGWVSGHIERCGACRAEFEALRAARSLMREQAVAEDCPVQWYRVRAALQDRHPVRRPVWQLAGAAVCAALLIAAAAFWMLSAPAREKPQATPRPGMAEVTRPAPERPAPELPKVVERTEATPQAPGIKTPGPVEKPAQRKPVRRWRPRYHRRTAPPHRMMAGNKPSPEPPKTAADAPTVVAVAPVEHVIDIVGVSVDLGEEHSYVIREVSADLDGQAQGVRL